MKRLDRLLLNALENHHAEKAIGYLQEGADANAKDEGGWTPLHFAAWSGYNDVVELLVAKGVDLNVKDSSDGDTPLHFAIRHGWTSVAELLIAKGADVNARNDSGSSLLLEAAKEGNTSVAEMLIAKGADVNAKDKWGDTPLHKVASTGFFRALAELLIAKGADVNAKDRTGSSPLWTALIMGHWDIADLLQVHGREAVNNEPPHPTQEAGVCVNGLLVIITKHFESMDRLIQWILTNMPARGRTLREWMTDKTRVKVLINSDAENPTTILAEATTQFRSMGIAFSADNVEQARLEGRTHGINGSIVTHWSSPR